MCKTINRIGLSVLSLFPILASAGCSVLGFSAYPIAHVMTEDTKEILDQTTRCPDVPRELAKQVRPMHTLAPGDELLVEVLEADDLSIQLPADQRIMADGTIDLGRYGRVVVSSMTIEQAESTVQEIVSKAERDSVRVNIRLIQPIHRYYVIGEVNSPGAYSLTGHETVLDALMEAGGLTARASACDILLARPTSPCSCRVTLPVCYRSITQLGDSTTNYHLKPGDRIFVSRQSFCEEMFAYVKGSQTCERCCKKQVACRDASLIESDALDFVMPGVVEIPPVDPPSYGIDGSAGIDGAPAGVESYQLQDNPPQPQQADGRDRRLQPSSAEDLTAPKNPPRNFDGELNFGELLDGDE
ncbi:polysaccharide biosynthesis/export family protein [Roseiconus lacunae]|uniref:polysaccharide biosynthesis/export family protein n=1 Tax=Roseiconus lacunae TaxID=2605694 RepID=UPI0011F3C633|nr:polysaccharide biosynthesis/export family protein [Roseiconus lacunae]WRQ51410.1 polysaccharide biosynthesis/export family protein [Stieleria sp. HD01]